MGENAQNATVDIMAEATETLKCKINLTSMPIGGPCELNILKVPLHCRKHESM